MNFDIDTVSQKLKLSTPQTKNILQLIIAVCIASIIILLSPAKDQLKQVFPYTVTEIASSFDIRAGAKLPNGTILTMRDLARYWACAKKRVPLALKDCYLSRPTLKSIMMFTLHSAAARDPELFKNQESISDEEVSLRYGRCISLVDKIFTSNINPGKLGGNKIQLQAQDAGDSKVFFFSKVYIHDNKHLSNLKLLPNQELVLGKDHSLRSNLDFKGADSIRVTPFSAKYNFYKQLEPGAIVVKNLGYSHCALKLESSEDYEFKYAKVTGRTLAIPTQIKGYSNSIESRKYAANELRSSIISHIESLHDKCEEMKYWDKCVVNLVRLEDHALCSKDAFPLFLSEYLSKKPWYNRLDFNDLSNLKITGPIDFKLDSIEFTGLFQPTNIEFLNSKNVVLKAIEDARMLESVCYEGVLLDFVKDYNTMNYDSWLLIDQIKAL